MWTSRIMIPGVRDCHGIIAKQHEASEDHEVSKPEELTEIEGRRWRRSRSCSTEPRSQRRRHGVEHGEIVWSRRRPQADVMTGEWRPVASGGANSQAPLTTGLHSPVMSRYARRDRPAPCRLRWLRSSVLQDRALCPSVPSISVCPTDWTSCLGRPTCGFWSIVRRDLRELRRLRDDVVAFTGRALMRCNTTRRRASRPSRSTT